MLLIPKVEKIKEKRIAAGYSQRQLSLYAELNGNTVHRIESGFTAHTHHLRAREIARVLKCDVNEIFEEVQNER